MQTRDALAAQLDAVAENGAKLYRRLAEFVDGFQADMVEHAKAAGVVRNKVGTVAWAASAYKTLLPERAEVAELTEAWTEAFVRDLEAGGNAFNAMVVDRKTNFGDPNTHKRADDGMRSMMDSRKATIERAIASKVAVLAHIRTRKPEDVPGFAPRPRGHHGRHGGGDEDGEPGRTAISPPWRPSGLRLTRCEVEAENRRAQAEAFVAGQNSLFINDGRAQPEPHPQFV